MTGTVFLTGGTGFIGWQIADVGFGLTLGGHHRLRPESGATYVGAPFGFGLTEQRGLTIGVGPLLGFQNKAVTAVEVDPPPCRTAFGDMMRNTALVSIVAATASGCVRQGHTDDATQLVQKRDIVGLLSQFCPVPSGQEGFDRGTCQ